jgi:hypothetical protein
MLETPDGHYSVAQMFRSFGPYLSPTEDSVAQEYIDGKYEFLHSGKEKA